MIRLCTSLALLLMLICEGGTSLNGEITKPPAKGQVIFACDFEADEALRAWTGPVKGGEGFQSRRSVWLSGGPGQRSTLMSMSLPPESFRGCTLRGTAMVKAKNVSAKPNPWNGIKFMLAIETPDQKQWPQAPLETGTFDWRKAALSAKIPTNATRVTLVLGLEEVTGDVWFDDIKITVAKLPLTVLPAARPGPVYKGHDQPRLRGTMVSPQASAEDLRVLGLEWKANLIRWQLIRNLRPQQPSSLHDYDAWLEGELMKLDRLLPACEQYGLRVVVDLHSPPGGRSTTSGYVGSDDRLFTDPKCQEKFIEIWRKIATRYKSAKVIWGYDLANEPVEENVGEDCLDWHDLAERAGKAIREVDPIRALIVEAPPWGGPSSLSDFTPINVSNVVYSVHMYEPSAFTHQGVFQSSSPRYTYPGLIAGREWNRESLEGVLRPVMEFQKRYNVHIYIGEFSAIRWAPEGSGFRYLRDVIDIFERQGWDWSYHAFREWQGWSVEHGSDRNDTRVTEQPTDRKQLLLEWFARNKKLF